LFAWWIGEAAWTTTISHLEGGKYDIDVFNVFHLFYFASFWLGAVKFNLFFMVLFMLTCVGWLGGWVVQYRFIDFTIFFLAFLVVVLSFLVGNELVPIRYPRFPRF
jgi:hypothetical protein